MIQNDLNRVTLSELSILTGWTGRFVCLEGQDFRETLPFLPIQNEDVQLGKHVNLIDIPQNLAIYKVTRLTKLE